MLSLLVGGEELFDERTSTFISTEPFEVDFEHSLLSLSKWESKFNKPFLGNSNKTTEEALEYVGCMVLTKDVPEDFLDRLTNQNLVDINDYVNSSQSATTFGQMPKTPGRGEIITSELIYYWMVAFNIPFECESWHLNRLFSLIKICNIKNSKPQKMSRSEMAQRNHELNAQRKAKLNTTG